MVNSNDGRCTHLLQMDDSGVIWHEWLCSTTRFRTRTYRLLHTYVRVVMDFSGLQGKQWPVLGLDSFVVIA
jgi:hypothetical protein